MALLASLSAIPLNAAPFWYDVITNYPGGCITTNTTVWYSHPPGSGLDALIVTNTYTSGAAVNGKRLRINGLNSEYVMRLFDQATTNSTLSGIVYASFVANANFVPAAGQGTYFATFDSVSPHSPPDGTSFTNGFDFRGRVFEIGNTNAYPFTNTVASTYRFGVANAAGDPAQGGGPSIIYVPIDLVRNVDYQVVLKYDIDNAVASIWVNPASESDTANWSGPTSDAGAAANGLAGLLFRQRTGGGTVDIRDVAVGTSFADVMTNAPGPVLVANNFNVVTNYAGNPALLEVFATSIGGGPLSYQWYRVAGGATNAVAGGTSQALVINSLTPSDTGAYFCAVTNAGGLGALSSQSFYISVNAALSVAPFFTNQPASGTAPLGGTLTLSSAAFGTGPLTYSWTFNGNIINDGVNPFGFPGDACVVSGSQTPTLTISKLSTNETGNYRVTVHGAVAPDAVSTNAHIAVNLPAAVSVAYIRSLENAGNNWQETDVGDLFTVTGVVTIYTNTTSGNTASYYIQDATGGINFFVTGDSSFRPTLGDILTGTGTLSMFNNNIELFINKSINPYADYGIVGHTNVLPASTLFAPFSLTNSAPDMEYTYEGRLVTITNVGFTGALTIGALGAGNTTLTVTNASGSFTIFFPNNQDPDVASQTLQSRFAWSITGVIVQNRSGTTWGPNGYQLYVTRIGDVVTNPPPPVTASAKVSGNNVVLRWEAVPYTIDSRGAYSYSVLAATNVAGPYSPLATGLLFNDTNGVYTDTNALSVLEKFYKVASPENGPRF
jgi:hypothetical protein